jgi:hypothetical protein
MSILLAPRLLPLRCRHAVHHGIPIMLAGLDMTLSDTRIPAAPQIGSYYLKPYPFTAGAYGTSNLFECKFDPACELAFFHRWGCEPPACLTSNETILRAPRRAAHVNAMPRRLSPTSIRQ